MTKFTEIKNRDDLFSLLNISNRYLSYLLYNKVKKGPENLYCIFKIPKRSGGERTIAAPMPDLKFIQKRLAYLLWSTQKNIWRERNISPNLSHAFQEGKSIITNAKVHRNKKILLNLDLENFFESFHFGRVKGFFEKNKNFKVPSEVALVIAQLCCYKGSLPQGAPTSPIITNLICQVLDYRLLKLAKHYKLDYSRYADDLTFSTNNMKFIEEINHFLQSLQKEIERAGFKINEKKTRLQYFSSRQVVTGLTVNKKINVSKEFYKNTRAMAYNLYKNGEFTIEGQKGTINQLEGRFSFINQLDKYNNNVKKENSLLKNTAEYQKFLIGPDSREKKTKISLLSLNSREKEYQKFLFYKYFYGNHVPTIVTEGKTDIRYIKAALKKLYNEYPNLVEKKEEDYLFKVRFLKRGGNNKGMSRFLYFFNFPIEGADAMKNLYNFFCDKDNKMYPNYVKYFYNLGNFRAKNPTFFIFDNELVNNKKPLKNFINYTNNEENILSLKQNLSLQVADNLYIITHKLMGDAKESEIEDLFDQSVLAHEIEGKTFSRKSDYDSGKNYGKEIFSKYIYNHFENIDFENFKPLLNRLDQIILDYKKN